MSAYDTLLADVVRRQWNDRLVDTDRQTDRDCTMLSLCAVVQSELPESSLNCLHSVIERIAADVQASRHKVLPAVAAATVVLVAVEHVVEQCLKI